MIPHSFLTRRHFIQTSIIASGAILTGVPTEAADAVTPPGRKMKICLNPGMIGVRANMRESIKYAVQYGYESTEVNMGELASMSDSAVDELRDQVKAAGLAIGAAGTGVPMTQAQEQFNQWLAKLPKQAAALKRFGCTRLATWISCGDNKLTYSENFKLHAKRVGDIATVLGDQGITFGLEYIGPKTSWSRSKNPFIHTMRQMKELIAETGKTNVGFLLDSWHWYTSGETPADVLTLQNKDVVVVHINDAPAGIATDQQIDSKRALPAATGVINIGGFLGALMQIGYDGPVMAEPFDDVLRKQTPDEALKQTITAIRKALAQVK